MGFAKIDELEWCLREVLYSSNAGKSSLYTDYILSWIVTLVETSLIENLTCYFCENYPLCHF